MQYDKYTNFLAKNLELAPCLSEQLHPLSASRTMRDVIEQELQYLVVRPWRSLDLSQHGSFHVAGKSEESVHYAVYAHIEGEEGPSTRARMTYSKADGTVLDKIKELAFWHTQYWAKQDNRPLVFDAVSRRTSFTHFDRESASTDRKALSFFKFPEGFTAPA